MKRLVILLIICLCVSCSLLEKRQKAAALWFEENDRIKVVATTSMVADLVRAVGGERVDVWTLIAPGHDPHSYELVKGDHDFIEESDLIVFSGLGLEHGASMQAIQKKSRALSLGDHLLISEPETLIYDEGGALDPHIWMDCALWSRGLCLIQKELTRIEPDQATYFQKRAAGMQERLLVQHRAMREKLMQLPSERRYLVTAHDAFRYFTRAYLVDSGDSWEERLSAAEGLAPHGQVSLSDLADVATFIQRHHISSIFPESYLSRAFLQKLMGGLDLDVTVSGSGLCADTMLESKDFDYGASMEHNAEVIYEGLK